MHEVSLSLVADLVSARVSALQSSWRPVWRHVSHLSSTLLSLPSVARLDGSTCVNHASLLNLLRDRLLGWMSHKSFVSARTSEDRERFIRNIIRTHLDATRKYDVICGPDELNKQTIRETIIHAAVQWALQLTPQAAYEERHALADTGVVEFGTAGAAAHQGAAAAVAGPAPSSSLSDSLDPRPVIPASTSLSSLCRPSPRDCKLTASYRIAAQSVDSCPAFAVGLILSSVVHLDGTRAFEYVGFESEWAPVWLGEQHFTSKQIQQFAIAANRGQSESNRGLTTTHNTLQTHNQRSHEHEENKQGESTASTAATPSCAPLLRSPLISSAMPPSSSASSFTPQASHSKRARH